MRTYGEEAQRPLPLSPTEIVPVTAKITRGSGWLVPQPVALGKGSTAHDESCLLLLRKQGGKRPEGAS